MFIFSENSHHKCIIITIKEYCNWQKDWQVHSKYIISLLIQHKDTFAGIKESGRWNSMLPERSCLIPQWQSALYETTCVGWGSHQILGALPVFIFQRFYSPENSSQLHRDSDHMPACHQTQEQNNLSTFLTHVHICMWNEASPPQASGLVCPPGLL